MFERLDQIETRYEELTNALASPDITNDSARYQKTAKAHSEITPIVEKYREYKDMTAGHRREQSVVGPMRPMSTCVPTRKKNWPSWKRA